MDVDGQCDQKKNDENEPAEIKLKDHLVMHASSGLEIRGHLHQYVEYTDETVQPPGRAQCVATK